ncbi:hypothetical protein EC991_007604 [Linnemannia zychae]|nr:hypothetical protein EC991_007604 [Linnemannia zychae]
MSGYPIHRVAGHPLDGLCCSRQAAHRWDPFVRHEDGAGGLAVNVLRENEDDCLSAAVAAADDDTSGLGMIHRRCYGTLQDLLPKKEVRDDGGPRGIVEDNSQTMKMKMTRFDHGVAVVAGGAVQSQGPPYVDR